MEHQDWTPVVLHKRNNGGSSSNGGSGVHEAGIVEKKGITKTLGASQYKLENSDLPVIKKLSNESIQNIIQLRLAKSWNQAQLNQECRFPVNTIREIEARRVVPNIQQLNILNKVLKTGLTYEK
jgi:ribosome-binding protein aMBF1 (putative translation factor)